MGKTKAKKVVRELKTLRNSERRKAIDEFGRCCRCCRSRVSW